MFDITYKDGKILNNMISSPETAYATFNPGLCERAMKDFCAEFTAGQEMLFRFHQFLESDGRINDIQTLIKLLYRTDAELKRELFENEREENTDGEK